MNQIDIYNNLLNNMRALEKVYNSTLYGANHQEVFTTKILAKCDSKYAQKRLNASDLKEALKDIEAIETTRKEKKINPKLTKREILLLRKVMTISLKNQKRVPGLARQQLIISLNSLFEVFIGDTLKTIYHSNIDSLKSENTTLKDKEIIEAITDNNVIDRLIEAKIRKVLYGSFEEWIKHMNYTFGFKFKVPKVISEMFLIRNCLVHNSCKVSKELATRARSKRYKLGREIKITEKDYIRFFEAVFDFSTKITLEIIKKYTKSKIRYKSFLRTRFFFNKEKIKEIVAKLVKN